MSLPRETMLELMGLADGELEGDAKAHAEQLVASNDEARRALDAMRGAQVGPWREWLRDSTDARAAAATAGMADAVVARLATARAEDGGVVRLAPRARRSRGPAVLAAVGAALAMAASVALYTRSGRERPADFVPVASVSLPSIDQAPSAGASGASPSPPSSAMAERAARPTGGVEVNEIDAPARGVSVFEIPLGAAGAAANPQLPSGSSSVVIWVEDDPVGSE